MRQVHVAKLAGPDLLDGSEVGAVDLFLEQLSSHSLTLRICDSKGIVTALLILGSEKFKRLREGVEIEIRWMRKVNEKDEKEARGEAEGVVKKVTPPQIVCQDPPPRWHGTCCRQRVEEHGRCGTRSARDARSG